tara:strand:+ start:200 stop:469 length:270 start_codon:yes stop_codon:yes gene_type:complete
MTTVKEVWQKLGVDKVDREKFAEFFKLLSININESEINEIFTMLDIEDNNFITYEVIRIFFNMTKVYDRTKYPSPKIKSHGSYKIHPEK